MQKNGFSLKKTWLLLAVNHAKTIELDTDGRPMKHQHVCFKHFDMNVDFKRTPTGKMSLKNGIMPSKELDSQSKL